MTNEVQVYERVFLPFSLNLSICLLFCVCRIFKTKEMLMAANDLAVPADGAALEDKPSSHRTRSQRPAHLQRARTLLIGPRFSNHASIPPFSSNRSRLAPPTRSLPFPPLPPTALRLGLQSGPPQPPFHSPRPQSISTSLLPQKELQGQGSSCASVPNPRSGRVGGDPTPPTVEPEVGRHATVHHL